MEHVNKVPTVLAKTWWDVYVQKESMEASSMAAEKLMTYFGTIANAKLVLQREGVIR